MSCFPWPISLLSFLPLLLPDFRPDLMEPSTNQYEQERRQKMQRLRELGIDPFGGRVEGVGPLAAIRSLHKPEFGQDGGPVVKAAGRIVFVRDMGKLWFVRLRDDSGELQIALDKKRLGENIWPIVKLLDLGDQIVAEGALGATKTGEVTVWARGVTVAAKSLMPPPDKWSGLSDVELRYRQRYVDLFTNPQVMRTLKLRSEVVAEIRRYMSDRGFIEVETPMMQPLAGGAAARPFKTHHNALDIDLYLRIAPELYLKRLLVGGMSKVFELNRNFRNEGISPRHNPEFTMLEAYEAYGSWETMAELVEGMICHVAEKLFGGLRIVHHGGTEGTEKIINLSRPWRRVSMVDLVEERTGWKFDKRPLQDVAPTVLQAIEINDINDAIDAARGTIWEKLIRHFSDRASVWSQSARQLLQKSPAEQLVEVYEKLIEPTLIDPCFVTHVPSVVIPLARKWKQDEYFADVYELAINGQEISPGYSELNDPDVQADNFKHQVGDKDEQQKVDEDFLAALRYGMPPAGGMGLGIDRLVMMLTGAESIRDVILFPLMRPS